MIDVYVGMILNDVIVLGVGLTDDDQLIKKKECFASCQETSVNDNKQFTDLAAVARFGNNTQKFTSLSLKVCLYRNLDCIKMSCICSRERAFRSDGVVVDDGHVVQRIRAWAR